MSATIDTLIEDNERPLSPEEARCLADLEWCHEADRREEVFSVHRNPETYYEIVVESDVTLEDLRNTTDEEIWELMEDEVRPLIGKKGFVISSTYEGGGVAMQEPPLIHAYNKMGADITWLVSEPDDEAFIVTKKMHNLQQNVLPPEETFTEEDAAKHQEYGLKNFQGMLENVPGFDRADYYWIEDPQLAAMIPRLMEMVKAKNPNAVFIYRNHIQTDRDLMAEEGSPQKAIYEYLHNTCKVGDVDTYITHPVEQFAPYNTPNLAYMPPTSDLFEDLNKDKTPEEMDEDFVWIRGQIAKQNFHNREEEMAKWFVVGYIYEHGNEPSEAEVAQFRDDFRRTPVIESVHRFVEESNGTLDAEQLMAHICQHDQPFIDRSQNLLTGFARFDKAKGQEFNMELQKRITDKLLALGRPDLIPHTVISGNGATDDPDRNRILAEMLALRETKYAAYKDYITVVGLEHDYGKVNSLLRSSYVTENFSTKEGFEHRRTESMIKGVPSLSTNTGGLPLQGLDGEGGLVADLERMDDELDRIADEVVQDLLDNARYQARCGSTMDWASTFSIRELTTVANMIREARIINGKGDLTWKIGDILRRKQEEEERLARELGSAAYGDISLN